MPASYPKRQPFFSNRFCRLLTKAAVAQTIGPEGCWLLAVVAHQEDVCRYRKAVTFWNGQLLPLCGFGSERRLITARQKAIDAGWLHYEAGGKGKIGRYWVLVPHEFGSLSDTPVDEGSVSTDKTKAETSGETRLTDASTDKTKVEASGQKSESESANVGLSILSLLPTPKECGAGTDTNKKPKYPKAFETFWKSYPNNSKGRKRGKEVSFGYWKKIAKTDHANLLKATENYAREETEYIRDPERFLKKDWWRDWIEGASSEKSVESLYGSVVTS